ncbi:MAG: PIN domain-containing protein [Spirochaetia bacterium]|nr:PIN domain-containing protein [Spirochaetia bacterium]
MSAVVIDTSAWIEYFRGGCQELEDALEGGMAYLSPVVASELMSGVRTTKDHRHLLNLIEVLPLCACPLDHWIRTGNLRRVLMTRGISASTPDAHLAQATMDLGGRLLTRDRIFEKMARKIKLTLA